MSVLIPRSGQASQPRVSTARSAGSVRPAPVRVTGSAVQKQAQWLGQAADAERTGDGVEAELCRQYAEHWFRVSRGQD